MAELPSALSHFSSNDERSVAEFSDLLVPDHFGAYLTEIVETIENGRDPGLFWAKWIHVVVGRTPPPTD